jgi:hypothetical protein
MMGNRFRGLLRSACQIVNRYRTAYVAINCGYYGLVLVAMLYVALVNPALQEQLLSDVQSALTEGPLATVGGLYLGGNVVAAALLTFLVNLLVGAILTITVPSLIVPFAGIALGVYRAVLWGLLLAPTTRELALVMIPHSLTLILEGQGYILALLASYVHGMAFLRPQSVGVVGHRQGYLNGAKLTGRLYVLVVIVLAVAAVYEAVEVIAMVWLGSAGA